MANAVVVPGPTEFRSQEGEADNATLVPSEGEFTGRITTPDDSTEGNQRLETRARELSTTLRLLEQQRQYVRFMERERETAYGRLANAMKEVSETARGANAATQRQSASKSEMDAIFDRNNAALEELKTVAVFLHANFLSWRWAWEQYDSTRKAEKAIRVEMGEPRF